MLSESVVIDSASLEHFAGNMAEMRSRLHAIADGTETVDPSNRELLIDIDTLRACLEEITGWSMTFRGESGLPPQRVHRPHRTRSVTQEGSALWPHHRPRNCSGPRCK